MRCYAIAISADPAQPDLACGVVRAASIEEALRLVDHLEANAYPLPEDFTWPGEAGSHLHWWESARAR